MIRHIKRIDTFGRNIILVFMGSTLVNVFNLFYQLLIAHRMPAAEFAGFSSLLAVFTLISAPLTTLQTATAKYAAEFNAQGRKDKARALLSGLMKMALPTIAVTLIIFSFISIPLMEKLKIYSPASGYILVLLVALWWLVPVLTGALQGLELFNWYISQSLASGILKLSLAFILIGLGFGIAGALGSFLSAALIAMAVSFFPLRGFFSFSRSPESVNFKEFFLYLAPVAVTLFCFMGLVNFDMVLVKYYFPPEDAGFYSLAQILGKIFLFLPGAISIVMFPRVAGLKAMNQDTRSTLMRSLLYASVLGIAANIGYNLFPSMILKLLTGKAFPESIALGRLFGISMSFFALSFILMNYFLSVKDLRFIKYLILSAVLEFLAIILFHGGLFCVQLVLCVNSILLFLVHIFLSHRRKAVTILI